jgi:hypothetical protein
VDACSDHVAYVAKDVHNFVSVTDSELCCVGVEGGKAVPEVGCGAVEGCAGEVMHRGDCGAECPANLALEDVEVGIAKEASWRVKLFPMRSPRMTVMTRILLDCVSREVDNRALMRDLVVRVSSRHCLVKVRVVLSSIPRTM